MTMKTPPLPALVVENRAPAILSCAASRIILGGIRSWHPAPLQEASLPSPPSG